MTTIQTMTAHGGTPLHCRHREQGVCATPTGRIRAACQREVESGAFVYVWYDADHAIGFPSAAAAGEWFASPAYQALIPLREQAAEVLLLAYEE